MINNHAQTLYWICLYFLMLGHIKHMEEVNTELAHTLELLNLGLRESPGSSYFVQFLKHGPLS